MKYKLITDAGIVDAVDAVPFRFKAPKWLSQVQFFTARYIGKHNRPSKKFTVTEIGSGRDVCRMGFTTRAMAKACAQERFLLAAKVHGVTAVKKKLREQKLNNRG